MDIIFNIGRRGENAFNSRIDLLTDELSEKIDGKLRAARLIIASHVEEASRMSGKIASVLRLAFNRSWVTKLFPKFEVYRKDAIDKVFVAEEALTNISKELLRAKEDIIGAIKWEGRREKYATEQVLAA